MSCEKGDCTCKVAHVTKREKSGFVYNFPPIKHREEWTLRDYAEKVHSEAGEAFGAICHGHPLDMVGELLDVIHAAESTLRFIIKSKMIEGVTLGDMVADVIDKNAERGYY